MLKLNDAQRVFCKWVLVSIVSFAGGWAALDSVVISWMTVIEDVVGVVGVLAMFGVVGMYWFVLRRQFPQVGWWVLGTTVGLVVGSAVFWLVRIVVGDAVARGMAGAVAGAVAGIIQWPALRRQGSQIGWWVLVSIVGWAVGWAVGGVVAQAIYFTWFGPMFGTVFWAVAVAGIMQLLILRRQVSQVGWQVSQIGWWVLGNIVGGIVGLVINYVTTVGLSIIAMLMVEGAADVPTNWAMVVGMIWVVTGAVAGAVAGIIQWFALRRQVSQAGWWVLVTIMGWFVSWVVFGRPGEIWIEIAMSTTVAGAMAGVTTGAITGIALVGLLRDPVPEA